ncbi:exonuclease SbcCD subunit D [Cellulomonas hominis]
MRLLHTSDWHLGRTLHGVDMVEHQAAYLDHLVELASTERVTAVLVSGDVYDRAIPPVEAVALLSQTLARLAEHTTVVLTPGNHDSALRLGFGAALMRDRVRVRASVAEVADPVVLSDDEGEVLVYALPYLDPDVARPALARALGAPRGAARDDGAGAGDGTDVAGRVVLARSHEAVLAAALELVRADLDQRVARAARAGAPRPRSVVMAHAFVVGGEPSESERDIRVGGVDHVPAGVFAGIDYVALGHLHGPQQITAPPAAGTDGAVSGRPTEMLRYSGSPLAYSFSEVHQHKSTVLLELGPTGGAGVTLVPAPVPRRLAEVSGPLDELLGERAARHVDDWLRVTVTDAHRPADLYRRVKDRFPHALVVQHRPRDRVGAAVGAVAVTAAQDPLVVAAEFVEHVTGARPTEAEQAVLRRAYEQVVAAERSA